jgi:hypothetical protein
MPATFPDDHELVGFFEAAPAVLDPDAPWRYNTLDFTTERQGILVRCRIKPSYGDISVRLDRAGGTELTRVEVTNFRAFSLIVNAHGEALVATSEEDRRTFCLMLKPRVWVGLGYFRQIPPELCCR